MTGIEEAKILQKVANALSSKNGIYLSKVINGVTIGVSKYPFGIETTGFVAFKKGVSISDVKKFLLENGINIKEITIANRDILWETKRDSFILLMLNKEGIVPDHKDFLKLLEIKNKFSDYLIKDFEISFKEAGIEEIEMPAKYSWIRKLYDIAEKSKIRLTVSLDKDYIYSLIVGNGNFALRKKVFSGDYFKLEDFVIDMPVGAEVYGMDKNIFIVRPFFKGENFGEVLRELAEVATARKIKRVTRKENTKNKRRKDKSKGGIDI